MVPMALAPYRLTPLTALPAGASARIAEIRGGRTLTHKLLGLGLRVGSQVCVLHQRGRGLVLSSAETRVAMGGGVADQLWVADVEPAADERARGSIA
jgi:ferrous iron transport protein A